MQDTTVPVPYRTIQYQQVQVRYGTVTATELYCSVLCSTGTCTFTVPVCKVPVRWYLAVPEPEIYPVMNNWVIEVNI